MIVFVQLYVLIARKITFYKTQVEKIQMEIHFISKELCYPLTPLNKKTVL